MIHGLNNVLRTYALAALTILVMATLTFTALHAVATAPTHHGVPFGPSMVYASVVFAAVIGVLAFGVCRYLPFLIIPNGKTNR